MNETHSHSNNKCTYEQTYSTSSLSNKREGNIKKQSIDRKNKIYWVSTLFSFSFFMLISSSINLQSILRTHLPFKMAIRTFNVRVDAPSSSVATITWVIFGFQNLDTVAPLILPKLTRRVCTMGKKDGRRGGKQLRTRKRY